VKGVPAAEGSLFLSEPFSTVAVMGYRCDVSRIEELCVCLTISALNKSTNHYL
jgi:hypothetical protein